MDTQEHPMNAADVLSTMLFTLEQGMSPAELLDENSPLMDEARRVLKPVDPATQTDAQPVAWLAAYVNNVGLPDHYVTTHHELAVENDANRSPKPLFFNPPAPQRVPLTDEEIDAIEWDTYETMRAYARAVLAAAQEKK